MSQFGIIVNVDKCIGCQACFVACKEENKVAPGIQWNQIHRAENLQDRIINYFRVSCQHCDNPACLPVCPAKAIYKGPHGEVLVDQSKCIGCGACAMGLPVRCSEVQQKRQDILLGCPGLGFRSASAASAAHSRQSRKMHALRPAHLQRSST